MSAVVPPPEGRGDAAVGQPRCVFVIGLPRSGSTLLSRILNESPDILCVNDLYYVQAVLGLQVQQGPLPLKEGELLLERLLRLLRIRSSENDDFIGQFTVPDSELQAIRQEALDALAKGRLDWGGLMDLVLSRVARAAGKRCWADKTPQNFFHVELLRSRFPGARFVFLLRDPRDILASYKYAHGEGHDARRYHPLAYAFYWRSAVRRYLALAPSQDVTMLRYETLRHDTVACCGQLEQFLGTRLRAPDIDRIGHNSSFGGGARRTVTPTEAWLCERVCGKELQALGYPLSGATPRWRDLPYLIGVTLRFVGFQLGRGLRSPDARARMRSFVRSLRGRNGPLQA